jgi:hypothetical protein
MAGTPERAAGVEAPFAKEILQMCGSAVVYSGLIVFLAGLILLIRPSLLPPIGSHALVLTFFGLLLFVVGLVLPAPTLRVSGVRTELDEITPVYQFGEFHQIRAAVSPGRAFRAIEEVRADEIFLFRTLTWIRRGGRSLPEGILNPGQKRPLIEVATHTGFVLLASDPPREIVIGAIIIAPPGIHEKCTTQTFRVPQPPGFALATMNFTVRADGVNRSLITTETRIYANDDHARRRFAAYWRLIYPGSAIIRRMWLRAIVQRAVKQGPS